MLLPGVNLTLQVLGSRCDAAAAVKEIFLTLRIHIIQFDTVLNGAKPANYSLDGQLELHCFSHMT